MTFFLYEYGSLSSQKWTKRDSGNGDVFAYDLADQVVAVKLNIANADTRFTFFRLKDGKWKILDGKMRIARNVDEAAQRRIHEYY